MIVSRTASKLNRVAEDLKAIASSQGREINVLVHVGDVSKPETSKEVAELLNSECGGRLDCLVCNAGAGVSGTNIWTKHIHDTFVDGYEYTTKLNYLSAYYAAKYLIPLMLKPQSTGKTIINISSAGAHVTQMHPHAYSIAKLALTRLTQDIGENYADEGITAIALHPGGVMTPGAVAGMEEVMDLAKACEFDFLPQIDPAC